MRTAGDVVIDPSLFGPYGRRHIDAAGEASINAAETHSDYQTVLKPMTYHTPAGDVVTFSADVEDEEA